MNLQYCGSSSPVNKFRFGALFDVIGNVWQWTESLFYAFKGFEVYPLYEDFSTPTFDGQHNIIKGGSWASTGNLAVRDSRFAFRRHFYQHAGFRYLESSEEVQTFESDYIDDPLVVEECERGWGENEYCFANLSEELAKRSIALAKNKKKALVVGCGTGRTVFELARDFDEVEGIDSSARVFRVAVAMKAKGNIHYILKSEGDNVTIKEKYLDSYKLSSTKERVSFFQADAANLKQMYKDYDLIIAEVMLNKTYDPKHFLEMIHDRINKDGILVVAHSPQWSEDITTKDNWLGGYRGDDGEIVLSATTIDRILEKKFNKIGKSSKISYLVSNEESQMLLKVADVTFWQIR
ncbi:MAG: putative 4-mercaptohistidine N1-methyltransferase [Candidatus Cloacimonetes bacterium 4572_65]|nr:MAG: putative 4-mercaptohistidine N1-methyltransferase [Candidatus Cloacimonetes bacterium 4572_65]